MKTFMKILGFAIIGTALMFVIAVVAASILRSYNRETVGCCLMSAVGIAFIAPIIVMGVECSNKWVENTTLFCMAWVPMQTVMIVALL